jgi:hypothetical protein
MILKGIGLKVEGEVLKCLGIKGGGCVSEARHSIWGFAAPHLQCDSSDVCLVDLDKEQHNSELHGMKGL